MPTSWDKDGYVKFALDYEIDRFAAEGIGVLEGCVVSANGTDTDVSWTAGVVRHSSAEIIIGASSLNLSALQHAIYPKKVVIFVDASDNTVKAVVGTTEAVVPMNKIGRYTRKPLPPDFGGSYALAAGDVVLAEIWLRQTGQYILTNDVTDRRSGIGDKHLIDSGQPSVVTQTIIAANGQTVDIAQWKKYDGTVLARIDKDGQSFLPAAPGPADYILFYEGAPKNYKAKNTKTGAIQFSSTTSLFTVLQNMIGQFPAEGGSIAVAPGTFVLDDLYADANAPVTLRGSGMDATIFEYPAGCSAGLTLLSEPGGIGKHHFADFTIDGKKAVQTGNAYGLTLMNGSGVTIERVKFKDIKGTAIQYDGTGSNLSIRDCVFSGSTVRDIYLRNLTGFEVMNCVSMDAGQWMYLSINVVNGNIVGNRVGNVTVTAPLDISAISCIDINIMHNLIEGWPSATPAMNLECTGTIHGNILRGNSQSGQTGLYFVEVSQFDIISDNAIFDVGLGLSVKTAAAVHGNLIESSLASAVGIELQSTAQGVVITGNRIMCTGGSAKALDEVLGANYNILLGNAYKGSWNKTGTNTVNEHNLQVV